MQDRFAASTSGALKPGATRVLIVEDEPIIAFSLEDMLVELGYTVAAVASSVDSAMERIRDSAPELAILDVNLQGDRSYPVADALEDLGVKYVFATGYGEEEHPERHRHAPIITKPYNLNQVRAALAALES